MNNYHRITLNILKMRKLIFCIPVLTLLFLYSCKQKHIEGNCPLTQTNKSEGKLLRVGMVTGLKPEKIAYYKELHANTWVGVLKKIEECKRRFELELPTQAWFKFHEIVTRFPEIGSILYFIFF